MENKMGDKNIKKEKKKLKKSEKNSTVSLASSGLRPAMGQPELIKKEKKHK